MPLPPRASLRPFSCPLRNPLLVPPIRSSPSSPWLLREPLSRSAHSKLARRAYSSQRQQHQQQSHRKGSFFRQLRTALNNTKIVWYPIPVGLGICVVAFTHLRREQRERDVEGRGGQRTSDAAVRPMGSWQVHVLSTLPLKALSYYWGRFNEIPLPTFLRVPGFKLYSWIFGVNLSEVEEPDLRSYRNLAEFFYRRLKPGCRPIDPNPNSVVSPADGVVLQFGEVHAGGHVEQVKGVTYSLDALLGVHSSKASPTVDPATAARAKLEGKDIDPGTTPARWGKGGDGDKSQAVYTDDEEFAKINGISYNLPSLLSGDESAHPTEPNTTTDASDPEVATDTLEVGTDLTRGAVTSWWGGDVAAQKKRLFFAVVYLAPGDYHRFHSPVAWVVERRRHFAGELYSVSPFLQSRLPGLFTLNERVVLLGRWRYGMFSMTPVGATNVGSIKIHFDRELRTNSLTHDATSADGKGGFAEATYRGASALLGGHPLGKGAEMGGFNLGSTVVLVFEAPGVGAEGNPRGGFRWVVQRGQKVKVGEPLGIVEE